MNQAKRDRRAERQDLWRTLRGHLRRTGRYSPGQCRFFARVLVGRVFADERRGGGSVYQPEPFPVPRPILPRKSWLMRLKERIAGAVSRRPKAAYVD